MIGPGDQMREERDEQRVVEEVAAPARRAAGRRRACRTSSRTCRTRCRPAARCRSAAAGSATPTRGHQRAEVVQQELPVLEVAEHAEVGDHRQQHPRVPRRRSLRLDESLRGVPVDDRRYPQQDHERRIPRRVEQIARDQQIDLLASSRRTASSAAPSTHAKNTTNVSELKTMRTRVSWLPSDRPPKRRPDSLQPCSTEL